MKEASTENSLPRLISIEIEPGKIDFDPDVTEYTIRLDANVQKLLVRGQTEKADQSYRVSDNRLKEGENEIAITVSDTEGGQNVYRLHVIVGEKQETAALEGPEELQTAEISFLEHVTTGRNRYITIGFCACAALALVLWIVFLIKRFSIRREARRLNLQRQEARQNREDRVRTAQQQEEELLRQIELLRQKSREMAEEDSGGLRIIQLDETETLKEGDSEIPEDDEFFDDDEDEDR